MDIENLVKGYVDYLTESFEEVWHQVKVEPTKLDAYSAIGGLLSRQVTLSIELANAPTTWNGHSAPLFLRSMTDLYIALAWMLQDIEERPKQYILHGLGETKLLIEQYKLLLSDLDNDEDKQDIQLMIDLKTGWINSQRRDFFVEVDTGSWSHLNCRKMAQEAECEDLYRSCKYVDKTFRLFEKHFQVCIKQSPLEWWATYWESIPSEEDGV
jgi:hypothetical protein